MRILQAHVRHRHPGGSEVMYEGQVALLRARGHHVVTFERDSAEIVGTGARIGAALGGIHSPGAARDIRELIERERPEVAHFHNLYPGFSPSVLHACRDAGVPVVLSLHDYKLICPTAQYFRAGAPCHRCSGGREYNCLLLNCRGSRLESAAYAARTAIARHAGWIHDGADRFVACSEFVRDRYLAEGFPADRVEVIPNFVGLPIPSASPPPPGRGYAAFLGRLSPEKGVDTLLAAAAATGIPTRIAGSGASPASPSASVEYVGALDRSALPDFLRGAAFLVVPSRFEEPFGLVAAEAMSQGVPVIAARSGGLPEVVEEGVSGLLFEPGDATALAVAMSRLWRDPDQAAAMGRAGWSRARAHYQGETHCTRLERLYETLSRPRARPAPALI